MYYYVVYDNVWVVVRCTHGGQLGCVVCNQHVCCTSDILEGVRVLVPKVVAHIQMHLFDYNDLLTSQPLCRRSGVCQEV